MLKVIIGYNKDGEFYDILNENGDRYTIYYGGIAKPTSLGLSFFFGELRTQRGLHNKITIRAWVNYEVLFEIEPFYGISKKEFDCRLTAYKEKYPEYFI